MSAWIVITEISRQYHVHLLNDTESELINLYIEARSIEEHQLDVRTRPSTVYRWDWPSVRESQTISEILNLLSISMCNYHKLLYLSKSMDSKLLGVAKSLEILSQYPVVFVSALILRGCFRNNIPPVTVVVYVPWNSYKSRMVDTVGMAPLTNWKRPYTLSEEFAVICGHDDPSQV